MCADGVTATADQFFGPEDDVPASALFNMPQTSTEVPCNQCDLIINTLGGDEMVLKVSSDTTVAEVRLQLAKKLRTPPFTLKLLLDGQALSSDGHTLTDLGLAVQSPASLVLVRCPACQQDWVKLFRQLVHAIERRQAQEARQLVDLGAGFDGDGNVLKKARIMGRPGDWTADGTEPGNTMLHLAIRENLVDLALYLLSCDIDVNTRNDAGRTPLMQALLKRQDLVVEEILKREPALNICDYLQLNALDYALRTGNDKVTAQLVHFFDEDTKLKAFERLVSHPSVPTALLKCCANDMPLTAQTILDDVRDSVDKVDEQGWTALHYAHAKAMPELVEALMMAGASPDIHDNFGQPPQVASLELPKQLPPECPTLALRQCFLMKLFHW